MSGFIEGILFALLFGGAPRPIEVPAALRARTVNPEPSGLAWAPSLARYLVVSDDTGLRNSATWHAPFLLAMDEKGVLDAEPVPIVGLAELNDAESICAGPDGTFFLLTSHSPSKKGKRKAGRDQLLQLALDGRFLRIRSHLDLRDVAPALLAAAGVDRSGRLDLEAVAYHEGALYIGLKSPLDADGRAVIVRLDDPVRALEGGRVPDGALHRYAAVRLAVPGPSRAAVHEGIADMTFLPDGGLVLLGNAPKGMPPDGGGAMFWLPKASDDANAPVLASRFLGLKPEGVTLSPAGDSLVIVFDRDQQQPLWVRVPLSALRR